MADLLQPDGFLGKKRHPPCQSDSATNSCNKAGFFSHVVYSVCFHIARVFFRKPWPLAVVSAWNPWIVGIWISLVMFYPAVLLHLRQGLWTILTLLWSFPGCSDGEWIHLDGRWWVAKIEDCNSFLHQQRCDSRGITSVSIHLAGASPKLLNPGQKQHTHNTKFMYVPWSKLPKLGMVIFRSYYVKFGAENWSILVWIHLSHRNQLYWLFNRYPYNDLL